MLGQGFASIGAFPLAWIGALQFPWNRAGVFVVGMAVLISGSLLRRHCWRMLGSSFTGDARAELGEPYRLFMTTRKRLAASCIDRR
jgi:hypothetical protein